MLLLSTSNKYIQLARGHNMKFLNDVDAHESVLITTLWSLLKEDVAVAGSAVDPSTFVTWLLRLVLQHETDHAPGSNVLPLVNAPDAGRPQSRVIATMALCTHTRATGACRRTFLLRWRSLVTALFVVLQARIESGSCVDIDIDLSSVESADGVTDELQATVFSPPWMDDFHWNDAGCDLAKGHYEWRGHGFGSNINSECPAERSFYESREIYHYVIQAYAVLAYCT